MDDFYHCWPALRGILSLMKKRAVPTIIGNWKMYLETEKEAITFIKNIERKLSLKKIIKAKYYLAVPDLFVVTLAKLAKKGFIGVQNISGLSGGAYTGLQTVRTVKSVGASFTLLGHSEVRARGEDGDILAKKVSISLKEKMMTVLCIGEKERDTQGNYIAQLEEELRKNLSLVDRSLFDNLVIAYEPIWAIGKDVAATPNECFEAVIALRRALASLVGIDHAKKVSILYGGTVTKENASSFLKEGGVDGLLIGRASTDASTFSDIIASCHYKK
ncbi:MAG: triosephosphate isomerase [Patescibacteria group bacterium]|nr:triosephosphate isomerase [Patescibacteria group bacterium]